MYLYVFSICIIYDENHYLWCERGREKISFIGPNDFHYSNALGQKMHFYFWLKVVQELVTLVNKFVSSFTCNSTNPSRMLPNWITWDTIFRNYLFMVCAIVWKKITIVALFWCVPYKIQCNFWWSWSWKGCESVG